MRKLATSLKIEIGKAVSRAELAVEILRELDRDYSRVCAGEFESLADEWEEHCGTIGQFGHDSDWGPVYSGPRRIAG